MPITSILPVFRALNHKAGFELLVEASVGYRQVPLLIVTMSDKSNNDKVTSSIAAHTSGRVHLVTTLNDVQVPWFNVSIDGIIFSSSGSNLVIETRDPFDNVMISVELNADQRSFIADLLERFFQKPEEVMLEFYALFRVEQALQAATQVHDPKLNDEMLRLASEASLMWLIGKYARALHLANMMLNTSDLSA